MTDRLTIAARLLAGWAANPNERGTPEEAAGTALSLADALLAAAEKPAASREEPKGTFHCPVCDRAYPHSEAEHAPCDKHPWKFRYTKVDAQQEALLLAESNSAWGVYSAEGALANKRAAESMFCEAGGTGRVCACVEVAPAAPAIVPVKFDGDGHAGHWERGWDAQHTGDVLTLEFRLRPGEDAGELTVRIIAAVGRSA